MCWVFYSHDMCLGLSFRVHWTIYILYQYRIGCNFQFLVSTPFRKYISINLLKTGYWYVYTYDTLLCLTLCYNFKSLYNRYLWKNNKNNLIKQLYTYSISARKHCTYIWRTILKLWNFRNHLKNSQVKETVGVLELFSIFQWLLKIIYFI